MEERTATKVRLRGKGQPTVSYCTGYWYYHVQGSFHFDTSITRKENFNDCYSLCMQDIPNAVPVLHENMVSSVVLIGKC